VDEVVLGEVLHAAGHLDGNVGHVPEVQDPLGLPGPGHRHRQVGLGAVGPQVLVQVALRRALKYQAPAQLGVNCSRVQRERVLIRSDRL
jgi:hypothetical protein